MHSLEIALLGITIYNDWYNAYLSTFLISYFISHILAYIYNNKFNLAKQIEYCKFADTRCIHGIPYFGDVVSNLGFILAGVYQYAIIKNFYFGIICIFIGIGSTYFHRSPSLNTLYWNRLPMIFGMTYIMNFYTHMEITSLLLHGLLALEYHAITKDLSLYVAYQINMILFLLWTNGLTMPLGYYMLAKICEDNDINIYIRTKKIISGHTIKHILAALAMMSI